MHIAHIHWRFDKFGGGENYLHGICRAQIESGHSVTVISGIDYSDNVETSGDIQHLTVPVSMGIRSGKRDLEHILKIILKANPDIIHFHQTKGMLSPLIVKAIQKIKPSIKTIHDTGLFCPRSFVDDEMLKIYKDNICKSPMGISCGLKGCYSLSKNSFSRLLISIWEKNIMRNMDKLIVSSQYMLEELIRNGFLQNKIKVLPLYTEHGSDSSASEQLKDKMILFVGRIDSVKGALEFIQALSLLKDEKWEANIIGDGPKKEMAEKMVKQLKLDGKVKFKGKITPEKLGNFYKNACIVVMPSMIPESFGLVGIEAMAYRKPVVAFDSGGIREWLVDGETGFLVQRGNIKGLADKISQLLNNDDLSERMGKKGKERADNLFRKDIHLKKLLTIYKEAISERTNAGIIH